MHLAGTGPGHGVAGYASGVKYVRIPMSNSTHYGSNTCLLVAIRHEHHAREVANTRYSDYDARDTARPVRLDRTEGHVIIEGRAYPAREVVEALAQSGYAQLRTVGDTLVLGQKRISPIFKSRQERAMAALCHGSLAYCCPLSKPCAERDRALEILGLTGEDYRRLKDDSHMRFINTAKGLPTADWQCDWPQGSRTANRPAVDRGFGSDDYRRDFDVLERTLSSTAPATRATSDHRQTRQGPPPRSDARVAAGPPTSTHRPDDWRMLRHHQPDTTRPVQATAATETPGCKTCGPDSFEGLGALFRQGEISPFKSNVDPTDAPRFCLSCGRTLHHDTRRCPYCGAAQ